MWTGQSLELRKWIDDYTGQSLEEMFEQLLRFDTYVRHLNPLRFMEWARYRQGFGAARTKSERFMDQYVFLFNPDLAGGDRHDWLRVPPRRGVIYPASLFKGRPPVDRERIVCACCGEVFTSRRGSKFCSPACRQKVFRKRKSVRGA
jgi:hypothetical protein